MKLSEIVCPECLTGEQEAHPYYVEDDLVTPCAGKSMLVECRSCSHPIDFITEEESKL